MKAFVIDGAVSLVSKLVSELAEMGYEVITIDSPAGIRGIEPKEIIIDDFCPQTDQKPNDLNRTYGKKYRRSLRK